MSKWYEDEVISDFKVDGSPTTFQSFEDAEFAARQLALQQIIRNPDKEVDVEITGIYLDVGETTPQRYFVDSVRADLNIRLQSDED